MSTRALIAAALACALAILLAGGIMLILLSNDNASKVKSLKLGQAVTANHVEVSVLEVSSDPRFVRLKTRAEGTDGPEQSRSNFGIRVGLKVVGSAADQSSCQQIDRTTECDLSFDIPIADRTNLVAVYQGASASWALPITAP